MPVGAGCLEMVLFYVHLSAGAILCPINGLQQRKHFFYTHQFVIGMEEVASFAGWARQCGFGLLLCDCFCQIFNGLQVQHMRKSAAYVAASVFYAIKGKCKRIDMTE